MRFTIFYFSGTGNTKWAVNEFSNYVKQKNHECSIYSVEDKDEIANIQCIIDESDMIGFSFPIYGADIPNIIKVFFEKTICACSQEINHKKCFIMTTVGYVDAFGPFKANRILIKYNLELVGYLKLKICNNISTPKIKSDFISSNTLKVRLEKCQKNIDKLANKLINKRRYIKNIGPYLIPGIIIRKATADGKKNHNQLLSVDLARCNACMKCVNNCPTESIVYKDKSFVFLPTCTTCMRCYNFCPKYAVCYEGKYSDPSIYKRFTGILDMLKDGYVDLTKEC